MTSNNENTLKKEYARILTNGPSGTEDYELARELIDSGYAKGKYDTSKSRENYGKVKNLIWLEVTLKGRLFAEQFQPDLNQFSSYLDKKFYEIVNKLIAQKQSRLSREESDHREKILKECSRSGWDSPTGEVFQAFDNILINSLSNRGEIVWESLEETLKTYDPPFYDEMENELYSLVEDYFPLKICTPHCYLERSGWTRPNSKETKERLRYQLESKRISVIDEVKTKIDLFIAKKKAQSNKIMRSPLKSNTVALYDVFICHASEDKIDFVRPLAESLKQKKVNVWYDEYCIGWGDSIRQTIDKGLSSCKFGIVVFSHAFFLKNWPQNELDALNQRMINGDIKILPIWHGLNHDEIKKYTPLFSDRKAESSDRGIEEITIEICTILNQFNETI